MSNTITAFNQLLLAALAAGIVFGAVSQHSRFCLQGGLREAIKGQSRTRLLTYGAAMGCALIAVAVLQLTLGQAIVPTRPAYLAPNLAWGRVLIGGLMFGAGMMLARGCPLRMTIRAAQGSLHAFLLLLVMALCAYGFSRTQLFDVLVAPWLLSFATDLKQFGLESQGVDALFGGSLSSRIALGLVLGAAILVLVQRMNMGRASAAVWWPGLALGTCVAFAYWATGGPIGKEAFDEVAFMAVPIEGAGVQSFTYAGPLSDVVRFATSPAQQTFSVGVVLFLGTAAGALILSLVRREFNLQGIDRSGLPRQLLGAALTGAGAVIGLGCSIGHGLSGIASLSIGSVLATTSIFLGALAVLAMESLPHAKLDRAAA